MEMGYKYLIDFSGLDFALLKLYLRPFTTVKHPGPIIYNKGTKKLIIYNKGSRNTLHMQLHKTYLNLTKFHHTNAQ